ncbi:hypothetical protein V2G26_016639 [Clonostachys chloroleuca]
MVPSSTILVIVPSYFCSRESSFQVLVQLIPTPKASLAQHLDPASPEQLPPPTSRREASRPLLGTGQKPSTARPSARPRRRWPSAPPRSRPRAAASRARRSRSSTTPPADRLTKQPQPLAVPHLQRLARVVRGVVPPAVLLAGDHARPVGPYAQRHLRVFRLGPLRDVHGGRDVPRNGRGRDTRRGLRGPRVREAPDGDLVGGREEHVDGDVAKVGLALQQGLVVGHEEVRRPERRRVTAEFDGEVGLERGAETAV